MQYPKPRATPEPQGSDPKEVYAFFGLAAYLGQVLEKGLVNLAVALELRGLTRITRADVEGVFDSMDRKTLGQLINAAREKITIPSTVDAQLYKSLEQRNFLTHRFFSDHDEDFISDPGRRQMIIELREIADHFEATDKSLEEITGKLFETIGVCQDLVEKVLNEKIARATGGADAS